MSLIEIDDKRARAAFAKAPQTMAAILGAGLDRAAGEVAAVARQEAPKGATSLLTNSIAVANESALARFVAPATDYAGYVHGGRLPGRMPNGRPGSPFYEWVKRRVVGSRRARTRDGAKEVDELVFLIGRAIARNGIKPNPFMQRAMVKTQSRVQQLLRDSTEAGVRAVFG
ncbi:hypothetical protein [Chitinimonas sp.]|uniref:hypothetical protein n=1 Tax=Chitinimonas sp. TaxID=1934313 RepID=UPI0035B194A3